ncbi:AraC-type DNA-binding protein [Paenibacillus sp. UNCCL117]|uniref:helix-turn-helix domain-containing protein n=1 Tax=unclassified Paenibacillus TaxID=185978 RepID=UPI000880F34A|nr:MULTISPECIES: helix-turn-helix domain-containing protein [unclassified Paenibacillus]SDC17022.1 AraC-type DNA-binding protein [Paenibacillus sp. cl123]SFW17923.1 AraC-type DNA-binding protein [Paenibacillus sp. UNCCL117]
MSSQENITYLLSSVRKRTFSKRGVRHIRIPAYILCFITEGEGVIVLDGELHKVRPFQLYLLAPGMHMEVPEQYGEFDYYAVFFESIRLKKVRGSYEAMPAMSLSGLLPTGLIMVHHPQQLLQRMIRLYEHSQQPHSKGALALRLQFEELLHDISSNEPKPPLMRDERVEKSITYIEQHYTEKVSIEKLSEVAGGMPAVAFSRLFRDETGMPPLEYVANVRVNQAKLQLDRKNSRVKEVAAAVGFRSEFYFSRIFQRLVGVSPTLYMKRGTLKVAVASSLGFEDHLKSIGLEPVCVVDLFHYPGQSKEQHRQRLHSQLLELKRSRPDLIIADEYHSEFRDPFKGIAASVFLDFSVWDWKRNYEKIAELVNREHEAAEMLTRLELQTETTGQRLRRVLGQERVAVMQVSHRAIGLQGIANHPLNELLYKELALRPCEQAPAEQWRMEVQPESLPVLETEHLFIHQHHIQAGSERLYREMTTQSVWRQIPAVRDGRYRLINNWCAMSWTPLGRLLIMNELLAATGDSQAVSRQY